MVDAHAVAELDGVEDLVKHVADEGVHLETLGGEGDFDALCLGGAGDGAGQHVALRLGDHAEEVAIGAVVEHDVDAWSCGSSMTR